MLREFVFLIVLGAVSTVPVLVTEQNKEKRTREDAGVPLILTSYIESGAIEEARNLSVVNGGPFSSDIISYSGYFTVNKQYSSNLFFWFFPAEQEYRNAPIILWLEGGPGTSGLLALFNEFGPYFVTQHLTLENNPYSWLKNYSLIFIDNPVGTGFSFTEKEEGYATNQTQISNDLYIAIIQFLTMFPELQTLPFYIMGESYGGKHVPGFGYTIHQRNPTADLKINLQGMAVGNGATDPINMLYYSAFLYQLGLIDTKTKEEMEQLEEKGRNLIQEQNYAEAFSVWWNDIMGLFQQRTYYKTYYSVVDENAIFDIPFYYQDFINQNEIRDAIHVGDTEFKNGTIVTEKLSADFMVSVRNWLEILLDNYKVLYYSGNLDIIVAYPLSVRMYNELQYSSTEEYRNASRVPWYVDGELAGYMKSGGKFTEVLVRNAGHSVNIDKPKWTLDLINRFILDDIPR